MMKRKQNNQATKQQGNQPGFSINELMVTISIMVLLLGIVIINYRGAGERTKLENEANKLVSVLRQAQMMALTGETVEGVRPEGYGVKISAQRYILFADKAGSGTVGAYDPGEEITEFNLPSKVYIILPITNGDDIVFSPPEGKLVGPDREIEMARELATDGRRITVEAATSKISLESISVTPDLPVCVVNGTCDERETVDNCRDDCCEADCTAKQDSICHSACNGFLGCILDARCNGITEGSNFCLNPNTSMACCGGTPTDCIIGSQLCCPSVDMCIDVCSLSTDCGGRICRNSGTCDAYCEAPPTECSDGIDNDGDGATDLFDGGCDNAADIDETNCGDGICEGGEDSTSCPADCLSGHGGYTGYADWNSRVPMEIASTELLTDYQFKIELSHIIGMNYDFSDIRFTDSTDSIELPYWRQEKIENTSAVFWVKIPRLDVGSNTIYMYYGNNGIDTTSNGESTFIFFDDFNDLTKWTAEVGSPVVSDSNLRLNARAGVYNNVPRQFVNLSWRSKFPDTVDNAWQGWNTISGLNGNGTAGVVRPNVGDTFGFNFGTNSECSETVNIGNPDPGDNNYHIFEISWPTSGPMRLYIDNILRATTNVCNKSNNRIINFNLWTDNSPVSPHLVDWVFVRKSATQEPKLTECSDFIDNNDNDMIDYPEDSLSCSSSGDLYESYCGDGMCRGDVNEDFLNCPDDCGYFGYRAPITINSLEEITNYQVKIRVNSNFHILQGDYSDIRFTNAEGTGVLSYWRQSYGSEYAIFWVKIPQLNVGSNTIYMYYGNNGIDTTSNGESTFIFFDDFNNLNNWVAYRGILTTVDGILQLDPGDAVYNNIQRQYVNLGWRGLISHTNNNTWLGWNTTGGLSGGGVAGALRSNCGTTSCFGFSGGSSEITWSGDLGYPDPSDNNFHVFESRWFYDPLISKRRMTLDVDGTQRSITPGTANIINQRLIEFNHWAGGSIDKVDWVYVRKSAMQEPSYSFGAEE